MTRLRNPLAPGYSRECIALNIGEMVRAGRQQTAAVATAYAEARKWYRRAHAGRALPAYLRAHKKNPVPASSALSGQKARIKSATRLYEDFTGQEPEEISIVDKPEMPDVLLAIGRVTGLMYETVRDGQLEDYIHEFSGKARPTFAVSHDGKRLFMLGGAYNFTARGIVDKR